MSSICTDYYYVEIGGVKSVVLRVRTKIEESWFNFDGTEITDESVISSIKKQATDENHIDSGKAFYETLNKVEWTKFPKEGNENRKGILLDKGDIIVAQDETGHQYVLAQMNDWNVADFGSSELPFNINSTVRPTVQYPGESGEEAHDIAYLEDIQNVAIANIPIRSLKDEVYPEEDILKWFGVETIPDLKRLILGNKPIFVKYGIQLSGNPMYYKMLAEYVAFESGSQVKMVFTGLDTSNDKPSVYTILMNLDGTIISGNSNVLLVISDLCDCGGETVEPEPEPEPEPTYEYKYDFNDFWVNEPHAEIVSNSEIHINGKTNRTICGYTIQNLGLTNFSCGLEVSGIEKVKEVYPDFYLSIYTNTGSPENGVILQDGDNSVNLDFDSSSLTIFITPTIESVAGQTVTFDEPVVIKQKPTNV